MMFVNDVNAVQEIVQPVKVVGAVQARPHGTAGAVRLEQPLLVLAIGGSGKQTATRLKAAFIERFGQLPENALIRCFDSADEAIAVREGRHGQIVALEPKSEFELLERVPLAGIKRDPHYHPAIVTRLGANLPRIRRASIGDGAAQERPQGLTTLLWSTPKIMRILDNTIRRLVERNDDLNRAAGERIGLNIVLIGSACGGQGSGALHDLAQLTHKALRKVGDLEDSSRFIGMVLLPGAFPGVRGANLQANTQAFFLELDTTMQGGGFRAAYPGRIEVNNLEAPFDVVFVLDGIDERRQAFANLDEVCDLAAQSLAVLLGSEVGMREIFSTVNDQGVLHGVSTAGYGTYLGTVGQASVRFPAQPTADRCVLRLAAEAAAACLADLTPSAPPAPSTGSGQALRGKGDGGIGLAGTATLRERLRLNANGAPYDVQVVAPAGLAQAPSEEQPALARTLVAHFQQRRIHGDAFAQIKATAEELTRELRAELNAELTIAQNHGNLVVVSAWLRAAQERLQAQYGALMAEAERLAVTAENSQKAVDAASAAMDQAADSLPVWRKGRVRTAVSRYVDEAGPTIRLHLEQRITEAAAAVAHGALNDARSLAQQAAEATQRLEQARSLLREQEAELARLAMGRSEINLATPELVERLYAQYRTDPAALVQQVAGNGAGLLAWSRLSPADLAARLLAAAEQPFKPLREITVEDVLAMQWDDRSAQQWVSRLADLAAGAWNLDQARLPDGGATLASFLTIGVCDATGSIFANCGYTLVATHDPERIVALRTIYGASFDTLKGADEWQRAYEAVGQHTPLHVMDMPAGPWGLDGARLLRAPRSD